MHCILLVVVEVVKGENRLGIVHGREEGGEAEVV